MRTYTYYIRDVQGNIMATYSRNFQETIDYASLTFAQVNQLSQGLYFLHLLDDNKNLILNKKMLKVD
jgi:hypothetical protein